MSLPWCCQTVSADTPRSCLPPSSHKSGRRLRRRVGTRRGGCRLSPRGSTGHTSCCTSDPPRGPRWRPMMISPWVLPVTCRYQMSSKIRVLNSNYWVWSAVCLDRHSFTNINNLKKNNMVMVSFERCWMMMWEVPTLSDTLGLCSVQSSGPGCGKGEGGPEKRLYGHPPHPVSLLRC